MNKSIKKIIKGLWDNWFLLGSWFAICLAFVSKDFDRGLIYIVISGVFSVLHYQGCINKKLDLIREDNLKTDTSVVEIISGTTDILKKIIKQSKEEK